MVTGSEAPKPAHRRRWILFHWYTSVLLVLGIVVLANMVSRRHYSRFDLTQNQELSLTSVTREVLRNLEDVLAVQAYVSGTLPETYVGPIDQMKDLLLEYKANARGNVRLTIEDPQADPMVGEFVKGLGIVPVQVPTLQRDRRVVVEVYCAVAVFYRDQQSTIVLTDPRYVREWVAQLEYELTRKIASVSVGEASAVGLLAETNPPPQQGQRPVSPYPQFYALREHLMSQHDVVDIDLTGGKSIPANVDTLIIARPRELSDRALFEIDQYLMRGGKILFMVDRYDLKQRNAGGQQQIFAEEFDTGLLAMLEHYGVKIEDGLVKDEQCDAVTMYRTVQVPGLGNARQPVPVSFPYAVKVDREGLHEDHPITGSINEVTFRWASPLTLTEEGSFGKVVHEIARSSDRSWVDGELTSVGPDPTGLSSEAPPNAETEPELLAAVLTGKFDSFFEGKLMPLTDEEQEKVAESKRLAKERAAREDAALAEQPSEDDADAGADAADPGDDTEVDEAALQAEVDEILAREPVTQSPKTRIMVIGDADFIADRSNNAFGRLFSVAAIDWFTVGSDLISIQSRAFVDRSLREMTDEERFWTKAGNIGGIPLLVLILGLLRYLFRRNRRRIWTKRTNTGGRA